MTTTRRSFLALGIAIVTQWRLVALGSNVDERAAVMVDKARGHLHETDWAPRKELGAIPAAYFCNIFVADIARDSGTATWDPISRQDGIRTRDPLAREWEDPKFSIKGWSIVFNSGSSFANKSAKQTLLERKPGDVVSGLGHVGIVSQVGPMGEGSLGKTISASAIQENSATLPSVVENDWSFRLPRQDQFKSPADWEKAAQNDVRKFTVRRFVGV